MILNPQVKHGGLAFPNVSFYYKVALLEAIMLLWDTEKNYAWFLELLKFILPLRNHVLGGGGDIYLGKITLWRHIKCWLKKGLNTSTFFPLLYLHWTNLWLIRSLLLKCKLVTFLTRQMLIGIYLFILWFHKVFYVRMVSFKMLALLLIPPSNIYKW